MPRDVATQWNSTFDMLEFALLYCKPLDELTGIWEMKLQSYELSEMEWTIAEKLSGVLKVRRFTSSQFVTQISLDIQAGDPFFLCSNTKPFESHPCHGLHQQTPHFWCCQHGVSPLDRC